MDKDHPLLTPKKLTTLASAVQYPGGNKLLHKFVLDNSYPYPPESESYINLILLAISGVDVNATNDEGHTALHLAVLKENLLMVRKLLSCLPDIDVNKGVQMRNDRHLQNALYLAAGLGHLPIVQELVNSGADVNIRYGYGNTLLCHAAEQGHMNVVKFLFDRVDDVRMVDLLLAAALSGNVDILQFLVNEKGADVNARGSGGQTPLHKAMTFASVQFLVGRGAKIHAQDDRGRTPLHQAVQNNNMDGARLLLDIGASVNHADGRGWTPLHIAAQRGLTEIAIMLLNRGAEVDFTNSNRCTPLHIAAVKDNADTVVILLEKGADRNARNRRGKTPLDMAMDVVCRDLAKSPKSVDILKRASKH